MVCQNCGKKLIDGVLYCRYCGTKLGQPRKQFCRKCGTPFGGSDKFCIKCGARVNGTINDYITSNSLSDSELKNNTSNTCAYNTSYADSIDSASYSVQQNEINKISSSTNKTSAKTEVHPYSTYNSNIASSLMHFNNVVTKRRRKMNVPFAILTFLSFLMAIVLFFSQRFSSPTRDFYFSDSYQRFATFETSRNQKDGFNENNNLLEMGYFTISIPNYWKADTTEEYRYRAYAETSGKVAWIGISSEYDENNPVNLETLRQDVEDGTVETALFSGFDSYNNVAIHDYHNGNVDGYLLSADIQTMGIDGFCEVLVIPSVDDNRLLFVVFSQTNNTKYDYSQDAWKIMNSITYTYNPEDVDASNIDVDNLVFDYAYYREFLDYERYYLIDTDAKVVCCIPTHDISLISYGKYRGNIMAEIEVFYPDSDFSDIMKFPEGIGKDGIFVIESMDINIHMTAVPVEEAMQYL